MNQLTLRDCPNRYTDRVGAHRFVSARPCPGHAPRTQSQVKDSTSPRFGFQHYVKKLIYHCVGEEVLRLIIEFGRVRRFHPTVSNAGSCTYAVTGALIRLGQPPPYRRENPKNPIDWLKLNPKAVLYRQ
ncbi:hypothetical protein CEXT_583251 [Caerostris extrusa]|uniref:Uncharacterized protein n=1 Tax=Caerostris extrusa TaxID=172846 RepID=A0AAV4R0R8_CAEEX|nr:hypothetical protein CEXT_583251 [Caerostris extrusa]